MATATVYLQEIQQALHNLQNEMLNYNLGLQALIQGKLPLQIFTPSVIGNMLVQLLPLIDARSGKARQILDTPYELAKYARYVYVVNDSKLW